MNRYRSRGGLQAAVPLYYDHYYLGDDVAFTHNLNGNSLQTGTFESMTDVVTPKFSGRQSKGEVIFNPMDHRKFEYSCVAGDGPIIRALTESGPGKFQKWVRDGRFFERVLAEKFGVGNALDHPFASDILIPDMLSEASTKVLADRGQSDSNMFESVAQIGQTLDLLKSPISSLFKMVKAIKKESRNQSGFVRTPRFETELQLAMRNGRLSSGFNKKNVIEAGKTAADRSSGLYLQYRYGLLPLMSDIETIIKGLSKVKGSTRKSSRSNLTDSKSGYSSQSVLWDVTNTTVGIQKTDHVSVRAVSLDEFVADLGSNLGFTAKGLLRTPWDLIPFSFVEDWFTNFSDFLLAFAPAPGYKCLGSCLTVERTSSCLFSPLETAIGPGYVTQYKVERGFSGSYTVRGYSKTRTGLVPPGIVLKHDFRFDKLTRQADAVALVTQQLLGIFGSGHLRPLR